MSERVALLESCAQAISNHGWESLDCVLMPGGYFYLPGLLARDNYQTRKRIIEKTTFSRAVCKACADLEKKSPGILWVAGVDTDDGMDQFCVAWSQSGLAGLGRKIFPTQWEGNDMGYECNANDYSSPHRVVQLPSGRAAVLCACYDMYGCSETPHRITKRTQYIRGIIAQSTIQKSGEPGFPELRQQCIASWSALLNNQQVSVGLAAIHQFEKPGKDVLWQRHGISTCSAALGGGLALGAAHFKDRLPDIRQSALASAGQPVVVLEQGQHRGGSSLSAIDGFDVNGVAMVRLYES